MISTIFLDFDSTLFSHKTRRIPPSALKAISLLRQQGIGVYICSGRANYELDSFDLKGMQVDGMILSNGQIICGSRGEVIYKQTIEGRLKEMLVQIYKEKKIPIYFADDKGLFLNYANERVIRVQNDISSKIPPIREYQDEKIIMASAIISPEEARTILKEMEPYADITYWHEEAVDILPKGVSKITGIKKLLQMKDIPLTETMAFGDGENDIGMLKLCAIGVAMGNAITSVKESADYVTSDIDDDGIYEALKHYQLIQEE